MNKLHLQVWPINSSLKRHYASHAISVRSNVLLRLTLPVRPLPSNLLQSLCFRTNSVHRFAYFLPFSVMHFVVNVRASKCYTFSSANLSHHYFRFTVSKMVLLFLRLLLRCFHYFFSKINCMLAFYMQTRQQGWSGGVLEGSCTCSHFQGDTWEQTYVGFYAYACLLFCVYTIFHPWIYPDWVKLAPGRVSADKYSTTHFINDEWEALLTLLFESMHWVYIVSSIAKEWCLRIQILIHH